MGLVLGAGAVTFVFMYYTLVVQLACFNITTNFDSSSSLDLLQRPRLRAIAVCSWLPLQQHGFRSLFKFVSGSSLVIDIFLEFALNSNLFVMACSCFLMS